MDKTPGTRDDRLRAPHRHYDSRRGILQIRHVVKRAQGGSDFDLNRLVALCPPCHAQTDAPYARGRLVVTLLGDGSVTFTILRGRDKWATRS